MMDMGEALREVIHSVQLGIVVGLPDNDKVEALGLVTAIVSCLGEVSRGAMHLATMTGLDRFTRCHLFDIVQPRACSVCMRDSAVNVLVTLVVCTQAPVKGLLRELLIVIGIESAIADEAVAELQLPEPN